MLALGYLILMVAVGDLISRRFFGRVSVSQRLASAFLVGLLISTWLTYLASYLFQANPQPLTPGDAVSLGIMALIVGFRLLIAWRRRAAGSREAPSEARAARAEVWDWVVIIALGALVTWMMVSTYNFSDGQLRIASDIWSDFGPTMAIAQSFVYGHNFPTQYPHFAGLPILYHFLFYFQVGNLTYLGLDPATANNALSIGSMVAMLTTVIALGKRLFHSAIVGRIGAALFFFHGSLSFVPYLASFPSLAAALATIEKQDHFLPSGFPYRGEDWGIWTQIVFLNQRHLASAIGVLLIVVLFVLGRLDPAVGEASVSPLAVDARSNRKGRLALAGVREQVLVARRDPALPGYLAGGVLLGLLPLWNSALFAASAVVMAVLFLVFPNRVQMIALAIGAAIPSIPQLLYLRPAAIPGTQRFPIFHWGYLIDDPTLANVGSYLAFTFGPKLLLVALALLLGTWFQRRVFLAFAGLVALAFLAQVSVEVLGNHKFINTWLVVANLFVAWALVWLWRRAAPGRSRPLALFAGRVVAVGFVAVIVAGGTIDLARIRNEPMLGVSLEGDRLFDWVRNDTKPGDVFLTDLYVVHPILLAGRSLFYGWPYYAWSAGYPTEAREKVYHSMFEDRDLAEVVSLLHDNNIAYVAIDDGLRQRGFVTPLNEDLYKANFEAVFVDTDHKYGNLVIYRVPVGPNPGGVAPAPSPLSSPSP